MPDRALFADSPESVGVDPERLEALFARVAKEVDEGLLPSAQVAVARHGRIAGMRTFGAATDDTLYVVFSATKAITSAAAWLLIQEGKLDPSERDLLQMFSESVALIVRNANLHGELSEAKSFLENLIQSATESIVAVDPAGRVVTWNPAAERLFGRGADEARGKLLGDAMPGAAMVQLEPVLAGPRASRTVVLRLQQEGDRAVRDLTATCSPIPWGGRDEVGLLLIMRDVTEQQRLLRELTWHVGHDPLTGLVNRAFLIDRAHDAVQRARAVGRTVGVLRLDLDESTAVNDTHGQAVGDAWLRAVGRRLDDAVAAPGIVARLDGDEFAVLVPDADGPEQLDQLAGRLRDLLAEPINVGQTVISGSVSIHGRGTTQT